MVFERGWEGDVLSFKMYEDGGRRGKGKWSGMERWGQ